jgi:hypothetical protein
MKRVWSPLKHDKTGTQFRNIAKVLSLQGRTLNKHEDRLAQYSAIQTSTSVITLIFSVITTGLLIYIAYIQYRSTERQTTLEYAKISPQFVANIITANSKITQSVNNKLPTEVYVKLSRGDAVVTSLQVTQDFRVSHIVMTDGKNIDSRNTCIVRSDNYFSVNLGQLKALATESFRPLINDPIFVYPKETDFYIVAPVQTWVKIEYTDVFGVEQETVLTGSSGFLNRAPLGEFKQSNVYGTVEVPVSRQSGQFPTLWGKPYYSGDDAECTHVVKNRALFSRY